MSSYFICVQICMSNSTVTALLIPNSTGYPCYHSLIVGQLFKKSFAIVAILSFTHYLLISGLASAGTSFSTYSS